jgi:plastocyanin
MRTLDLFVKLPLVAVFALAAACGGDQPAQDTAAPAAPPLAETPAPAADPAAPATDGEIIEVRMLTTQGGASGVFEPAQINARPGDVIRFIQADGQAAHNVSFPAARNPGGAQLPPASRYTTQAGETIDIPVTMGAGSYFFQCDPHATTGMTGTLTVAP